MKFLHTADLHIGKTVNECNLLQDQAYVLDQMLAAARAHEVDAFVIAGDVYDRSVPSAEAVALLDGFVTALAKAGITVLMVAGNHDSGQRLGFAEEILACQGVHIAGAGEKGARQVVVGDTQFVLLPFLRPAEAGAQTSQEAVCGLLAGVPEGQAAHRVLVTHYFVTDRGKEPALSDSESTLHVGGIDDVDASVFHGYDYVALGHIHKPQKIGNENVYYAGAPLAYSFSEDSGKKGLNLVTLSAGAVRVEQIGLRPLHAMRTVRGTLNALLEEGESLRTAQDFAREDYLRAVLTDEDELLNPISTLRSVYPNIMQIVLARQEAGAEEPFCAGGLRAARPELSELFASFYELVKGCPMEERRQAVVAEIAAEIKAQSGGIG